MSKKPSILNITKGTKTVILVMTVLVLIGVYIAYVYYDGINNAEDPRVIKAKYQYKAYNEFVNQNNFEAVFATLDTIENIYSEFSDYRNSYEMGVVYNNRSAVWITIALRAVSENNDRSSYLDSAKIYSEKSIKIYESWINEYEKLTKNDILNNIKKYYSESDPVYADNDLIKIIDKRADDIVLAQNETLKRLSVAYTNLGIIQRHLAEYDNAMASYKRALELWKANRSAKNNINILLGRPVEEASTIEKLFPEDKSD